MKTLFMIGSGALAMGFLAAPELASAAAEDETAPPAEGQTVETIWTDHCAKCHGEDGKGQTKMGRKLKVPDYTDPAVQAKLGEEEMIQKIKEGARDDNGKQTMKPFAEKLTDEQIQELIAHVRAFGK